MNVNLIEYWTFYWYYLLAHVQPHHLFVGAMISHR
jgi:uncharacterized protein YbgA (DUF1722 family)